MGNHPSHPSVPLDGYLAVRASIEARLPPPPSGRQSDRTAAAAATGCWGPTDGQQQTISSEGKQKQQQQENLTTRESAKSSGSILLEQGNSGSVLPPTLSVAETTDTNSDGAPDEFETAAAADELLGGPSQSFTRERAPHVRAQSPLPFPSMAHCSPTVSRRTEPENNQQQQHQHQLPLQRDISSSSSCISNRSSSNDGGATCRTQRVYAVNAFPSPSSRPKQLNAALIASTETHILQQGTSDSGAAGAPVRAPDARFGGAPGASGGAGPATGVRGAPERQRAGSLVVQEEDHEMFCPLSPNSALGSCTPRKNSNRGASKTKGQMGAAGAGVDSLSQDSSSGGTVSYGPACNHFPFLEGRPLQVLLPFLFGRPLGACMGVCVHWFMKISNGLAEMCAPVVKGFEASYGEYLAPVSATVKLQALHTTQGNDVRLDWVITARVLPACANYVLSLGYNFKYRHPYSLDQWHIPPRSAGRDKRTAADFGSRRAEGSSFSRRSSLHTASGGGHSPSVIIRPPSRVLGESADQYRRETPLFSVAVARAGSKRRLWLHRDMCRFHGDETGQAVLTHLGPVCVGDFIEIPVVLCNGIGAADVSSIRWLPPNLVRRAPRILSGPRALEAASQGLYEGCSLEMQYLEWFDGDQYRHMTTERLKRAECMEPQLHHESTAYSGIDLLVRRCLYRAAHEGLVGPTAQRAWGLQCKVVPQDAPIVFPLTRRGLLHDRSTSLQLRVGDILEAYLTIGGANV